jgi:hypothetical protein
MNIGRQTTLKNKKSRCTGDGKWYLKKIKVGEDAGGAEVRNADEDEKQCYR